MPLIASQQSSFSGTRTTLTCQVVIASIDAALLSPSKIPQPWTQANSVPDRLRPRRCTTLLEPSTSLFPETRRPLNIGPAALPAAPAVIGSAPPAACAQPAIEIAREARRSKRIATTSVWERIRYRCYGTGTSCGVHAPAACARVEALIDPQQSAGAHAAMGAQP